MSSDLQKRISSFSSFLSMGQWFYFKSSYKNFTGCLLVKNYTGLILLVHMLNGKNHNQDGPAIEGEDWEEYWLYGKHYLTKQLWEEKIFENKLEKILRTL